MSCLFGKSKLIAESFKQSVDTTDWSVNYLGMAEEPGSSGKRNELIDIASALFYEQGYGATGIKQIIDTAGIAKGTFYSHFKSKEEVGIAWLRKRHAVWNSWLEVGMDSKKSAKSKLLSMFDFLESWMIDCDFRGCAFLNTLAEIPNPENLMRLEILHHKRGLQEKFQTLATTHFSNQSTTFGKQKGAIMFLLFEGALVESRNFREVAPIVSARKEIKSLLTIKRS